MLQSGRTVYAPHLRKRNIRLEPPLEHSPQCEPDDAHIAVKDNRAVAHLHGARTTRLLADSTSKGDSAMKRARSTHAKVHI